MFVATVYRLDDEEVDSVKDEEDVMEVESGATVEPPTNNKEESSVVVSREAKMAEMRANLPLEERQDSFKAMLLERQVISSTHFPISHSTTTCMFFLMHMCVYYVCV